MHAKKKLEIVIDAAAVDEVVALVRAAGAKGHTIIPNVRGKGPRGVRGGHDIFQEGSNAMVLVVGDEAVILRALKEVMGLLELRAGVAFVSDVQVARGDHF